MKYMVASEKDLLFIMEIYNQNIEVLHGNHQSKEDWIKLLFVLNSTYYIVSIENLPIYPHQGIENCRKSKRTSVIFANHYFNISRWRLIIIQENKVFDLKKHEFK